nr:MAG TPA: hypothetical protein [Caudoviricetes sp.]
MEKKRLFQTLDEMNLLDIENGTRLVSVGSNFISADKIKQGTKISMGSDDSALHQILNDKVIPILLLVDKEEYFKLSGE